MANDLVLHQYKSGKFENGLMIVGFPSVGLVSSIAANFIIRTSKLDRVAGIMSSEFPPYTLVHEGEPSPPVRVYAGKRHCDKKGEQCTQLITVAAEFMPKPELVQPLATKLLDYAQEKGVKTIVSLEGINWQTPDEPKIFGVGSSDHSRKMLKHYGVEEMKEGMVSGITGVLLYEGEVRGMDVICLLGPARINFPDARGSAKLLEIVAKMLPEIKIDPEPLYKEAEEIERQIKAAMESVNQPKKMSPEESVIYG